MSAPSSFPTTPTTAAATGLVGLLTTNLFGKSDAFTTIIGMQFMSAFVANVFDPLMNWLLPDRLLQDFDIVLPDLDPSNDTQTTIHMAALLRKVVMLILVVLVFFYVL